MTTEIDEICKALYDQKIFPKVYAFKNTQLKRHKNPDRFKQKCILKKKKRLLRVTVGRKESLN